MEKVSSQRSSSINRSCEPGQTKDLPVKSSLQKSAEASVRLLISLGLCVSSVFMNPNNTASADTASSVGPSSGCTYQLGFRTLAQLIPKQVGSCLENETANPQSGDALQHTTTGLLVWRKADNFTAFTDGYQTWINGPYGLTRRLNNQRFSWENDGSLGTTNNASRKPQWTREELAIPLRQVSSGRKRVALTFDDGVAFNREILQILNQYNTQALFCYNGVNIHRDPGFAVAAAQTGNEFCNHTYYHPNLRSLFLQGQMLRIYSEIDDTEAELNKLGLTSKPYARPPYWSTNPEITKIFAERGYRTILASLDPEDWKSPDPDWLISYVVDNAKDGDIIVLHALHPNTPQALPGIITGLRSKGLKPGDLSQLILGN